MPLADAPFQAPGAHAAAAAVAWGSGMLASQASAISSQYAICVVVEMAAVAARPASLGAGTQRPCRRLAAASTTPFARIGASTTTAAAAFHCYSPQERGLRRRLQTAASGSSGASSWQRQQQRVYAMADSAAGSSSKSKVLFVCLGNICRSVRVCRASCWVPTTCCRTLPLAKPASRPSVCLQEPIC